MGAAFVLFQQNNEKQIIFRTIEKIEIKTRQEKDVTYIKYPKFKHVEFQISSELKNAIGRNQIENHFFCKELQSLFIELNNENEIKALSPDFELLLNSTNQIKEVVVMSKSTNQDYDFVLRSFCPWIGINEDPVTGSIHSVLGHFWQRILNKDELIVSQASERGGQIFVKPLKEGVEIGGIIKLIIKGNIVV